MTGRFMFQNKPGVSPPSSEHQFKIAMKSHYRFCQMLKQPSSQPTCTISNHLVFQLPETSTPQQYIHNYVEATCRYTNSNETQQAYSQEWIFTGMDIGKFTSQT